MHLLVKSNNINIEGPVFVPHLSVSTLIAGTVLFRPLCIRYTVFVVIFEAIVFVITILQYIYIYKYTDIF